ncbi:MAG TPA: thiazole biosynthesis adenylyltransferase ThiF [Planctomycetes bacterium]|nr:thiazole biosynthesis adenylyltransferase ThiF [Planctomycetota bacterium]
MESIPDEERFDRQVRFAGLGERGQRVLGESRVLLVGCGALGGVLAQILVRAGVGSLVLVDRDIVEPSNLPRQVLFDEEDALRGTPKVLAASAALARIGGPTELVPHAAHLDVRNLDPLAAGCDLILDGTDNLETRYLLNDFALERGLPWVYAGVVGSGGLVLPVIPGRGACLRCFFPEAPPAGSLPTCDSQGVILPAVSLVASLAAGIGMRLLVDPDGVVPRLFELDAWGGTPRHLAAARDPGCPACGLGRRDFLHRAPAPQPVVLCGRNTVQIPPSTAGSDPGRLERVAGRLEGTVEGLVCTRTLLRFENDGLRITLFSDGRALIEGTDDPDRARAIYDRTVGS